MVYFNVWDSFWSYSGGVYWESEANCNPYWINHAMLIVGYQFDGSYTSTNSYWILRNSWCVCVVWLCLRAGTCQGLLQHVHHVSMLMPSVGMLK